MVGTRTGAHGGIVAGVPGEMPKRVKGSIQQKLPENSRKKCEMNSRKITNGEVTEGTFQYEYQEKSSLLRMPENS